MRAPPARAGGPDRGAGGHDRSAGDVVVVGAGPAGLTAAFALAERGEAPCVLEKDRIVGGIARTECHRGYHFDMGGHRFFTKVAEIGDLWVRVLGDDFLRRPRLSRIYYRNRFFDYPLRLGNAFFGLGWLESLRIIASYARWRLFPHRVEDTFEQWVTNRFGRRLFATFFQSYTEKVWGLSCSEIRAEWAAQRIKDLSLWTAVRAALIAPRARVTSLIEEFDYPRLGPGMMWRAMAQQVTALGGRVVMERAVVRLERRGMRVVGVVVRGPDGREERRPCRAVISSMPLPEAIEALDPPAPAHVRRAAARLSYRDFLTVCLILDRDRLFPDNWIYVHDPGVGVGRIQNFKNWSGAMVPDAGRTSLGLEYFCQEGDQLWSMDDAALVRLGARELQAIGLARAADVVDGCVFRVPKSYPIYDASYAEALGEIEPFVRRLEGFQTIGRNGLHRYNNQDHSMLTGLLAVRNLVHGERHDLWRVNAEPAYLEEIREARQSPPRDRGLGPSAEAEESSA